MKVLRNFAILTCILSFFWGMPSAHGARDTSCDKFFPARGKAKAVVLLAHGANLLPAKLDPLAIDLAKAGFDVLRPAFTGHCGAPELFHKVTAEDWASDAKLFHMSARAHANGKPIYLVAYSFSAPIFLSFKGELAFDRYVFFAPALATHYWYPLLVWLARKFPNFTYPSRNLKEYLVHDVSSFQPIVALDEFMKKLDLWSGPDEQSLIWMDPEDELVSAKGLAELTAIRKNWRLEKISNKGSTLPKTYHHLIIDEASLGAETWNRIVKETISFLGGKK
jgi:hypothetical protein